VDMNEATQAAQVAGAAVGAGKAGSIAAAKYLTVSLILGAIGCASVVMAATAPKGNRNLFVCIMSTAIASICGGCYVAIKYGFANDIMLAVLANNIMALSSTFITVIGISFICGLPAMVHNILFSNNYDIVSYSPYLVRLLPESTICERSTER